MLSALDIRCNFSLANVCLSVSPSDMNMLVELYGAVADAATLGVSDQQQGRSQPPTYFVDTPELLEAWQSGWKASAELPAADLCQPATA